MKRVSHKQISSEVWQEADVYGMSDGRTTLQVIIT